MPDARPRAGRDHARPAPDRGAATDTTSAADTGARLLTGRVVHERLRPVRHAFRYPLFQIDCDVARLDALPRRWFGVDRPAPVALWQRDHGPRDGSPLDAWLRGVLADAGIPADGAIRLQAIPRVFGHAFNPVAFWYCHDREGRLRALYAEVRNTFGARHGYLLSAPGHAPIGDGRPLACRKTFHVSPFCRVEGHYVFRVRREAARSVVEIDYHDRHGLLIRTALAMRAEPLTAARVARALLGQPFGMFTVLVRIHWQALRLALKRVPFFGSAPAAEPSPASATPAATPAATSAVTPVATPHRAPPAPRRPSLSDPEARP
ncbi:DUF1365 domain-containing protein [Burkholderia plantarii]|uniref:DUF1365 domain-containing protein n=1 Tax=Burkholderia plantarii TaxID=41899 RepID=UPI0009E69EE4|nr:DUF1365 domain-containing protein [Burkholderia plantarii]GLZ18765.1 hypothetical protein Bpla01_22950 [Burkholderia plantarii]